MEILEAYIINHAYINLYSGSITLKLHKGVTGANWKELSLNARLSNDEEQVPDKLDTSVLFWFIHSFVDAAKVRC